MQKGRVKMILISGENKTKLHAVKQWVRNRPAGYFLLLLIMVDCSQPLHAGQLESKVQDLPGAASFTPQLQQQLANALALKGEQYKPRSKHLRKDGSPIYSNRLLLEASPYLQQHAHNPVNWFPWGDEAFSEAKRLNRPVLVSIGYSTCHWCHVMEEESYDNPEIADYLNRHFIAIKVDRESRPDIDSIYMRAVQTMTGHGGWPLNVWLLPNKQAFYGGTYFPPEGVPGNVGFLKVLQSINASYQTQSGEIKAYAQKLTQAIQRDLSVASSQLPAELNNQAINQAVAVFSKHIDPIWGGVGEGVKFPSSTPIRLLLREYQQNNNAPLLDLLKLTLDKMANGGIYDHLGGGFHRYSTDPKWLVPHFEKMLYDNAQLSVVYLEAYQLTKVAAYRDIVTATLDYSLREMTSESGGFYSATDADSLNDKGELEEGWFFTWTREDIDKTLDARLARLVADWFDIKQAGDLEERNVLHTWLKLDDFAIQQGLTPDAVRLILAEAKTTMRAERILRPPPLRDDKIIVAWNGLMISALAKAGFVLQRRDYLAAAQKCAEFLLQELTTAGRLKRIYLQGKTQGPAFLNDYALLINALLDLYQADTQPRWLQQAINLQKSQDALFLDKTDHQYFKTAQDSEKLLFREKPTDDGVIPSGNSSSAYNLLRLHKLTTDDTYRTAAIRLIKAMTPRLKKHPVAMNDMLIALDFELAKGKEVVMVLAEQAGNTEAMLQVLRETYIPEHVVMIVKEGEQLRANAAVSPLLIGKRAMAGKTTAFVCKNRVCKLPSSDADEFKQQLMVQ